MRVLCTLFATLSMWPVWAIDFHDFDFYQNHLTYDEIAHKIETYLEKDSEIKRYYQLNPAALLIGDFVAGTVDYILYLGRETALPIKSRTPRGLNGVKIALDPGHFGGPFAELEDRALRFTTEKGVLRIAEGDLTYLTALELKRLLEEEGAEVLITREGFGQGVIDTDFHAWIRQNPELLSRSEQAKEIFRVEYNREDLKLRADKINAFAPDLAIIIHYNAHEADSERGSLFTQSNYSMAFIPGAFCKGELSRESDRYEFLRLIVTDAIEESLHLSACIVPEFAHQLGVPLISANENPSYIRKASLFQKEGIYCRNLALTRRVHCPVCYGETLIQNHEEEAYRLFAQDAAIMGIPCSKRLIQVARCYFQGIKRYYSIE